MSCLSPHRNFFSYIVTCLICVFVVQENRLEPDPGEKPDRPPIEVEQPVEKTGEEPPQIKGPVEVAERKDEEEKVQLDRPEAGNTLI